jgi:hypothetical protein
MLCSLYPTLLEIIIMARSTTFNPIPMIKLLVPSADYGVSNIASLPTVFTDAFTKITLPIGATRIYWPMHQMVTVSAQVLKTANGAGFTSVSCQMQASNIGGTSNDVWSNITSAPTALAATDESTILTADKEQASYAHVGIQFTVTGGTCDIYVACHGLQAH